MGHATLTPTTIRTFRVPRHAVPAVATLFPACRARAVDVIVQAQVRIDSARGDASSSAWAASHVDGRPHPMDIRDGAVIAIPHGIVIAEHRIVCGRDMGVRLYMTAPTARQFDIRHL